MAPASVPGWLMVLTLMDASPSSNPTPPPQYMSSLPKNIQDQANKKDDDQIDKRARMKIEYNEIWLRTGSVGNKRIITMEI